MDAQADLSLCWAHIHFVGFVMRRLKYKTTQTASQEESSFPVDGQQASEQKEHANKGHQELHCTHNRNIN